MPNLDATLSKYIVSGSIASKTILDCAFYNVALTVASIKKVFDNVNIFVPDKTHGILCHFW